jgi:hypothetical protein
MSISSTTSNWPTVLERLVTVSPSTYGKLKQWEAGQACPLQLLWRGKQMLAPSPTAKIGDIVHKAMEIASSVKIGVDPTTIWENARDEIETELRAHFATRGLVPLKRRAIGYELKRQMALRMMARISSGNKGSASGPVVSGRILREVDLVSKDGTLKGRIDLAEELPEGWVLTDYKSGEVLETDGNEGTKIKESYELQILLYAHLFQEAKGIALQKAVLKTLDGKEHAVQLDEGKVARAGAGARALLQSFNRHIGEHPNKEELAVPMAASYGEGIFGCAECLFRPACKGYKNAQKTNEVGRHWPRDVWGKITSLQRSEGRVDLEIQNENRVSEELAQDSIGEFKISLEDSHIRHPALDGIEVGKTVGIYDFLKGRSSRPACDGPKTCVYSGESTRGPQVQ